MTAINNSMLDAMRDRRSAGESLGKLAKEIGLPWQRLWTMLYPSTSAGRPSARGERSRAVLRPNPSVASLTEKYRPVSLDTIWGQDAVVKVLRKFAAAPYPTAFIFEGETGTGKTSAALALASAIGCDLTQKEFGGVQTIASGEQSADAVREAYRQMFNCTWHGSGWKVVIVNEADRMARPAETIWLDVLEAIPAKTVIIFTTNESQRLSQRFLDRCARLAFQSDAATVEPALRELLDEMWRAETGDNRAPKDVIDRLVRETTQDGRLSFRRAVQALAVHLAGRE